MSALGRDARDQGLRAVPAGDAEQIGPTVHRLPRQRGHVDARPGLRAVATSAPSAVRLVLEPELPDLATA